MGVCKTVSRVAKALPTLDENGNTKSSCKSVMQTSLFLKSLQAINKSRFNTLNVQTSLLILFSFTNVSKTGIWTQVSKDDERSTPFSSIWLGGVWWKGPGLHFLGLLWMRW